MGSCAAAATSVPPRWQLVFEPPPCWLTANSQPAVSMDAIASTIAPWRAVRPCRRRSTCLPIEAPRRPRNTDRLTETRNGRVEPPLTDTWQEDPRSTTRHKSVPSLTHDTQGRTTLQPERF